MEKQIDICATCVHDEPGYCSVIGTIYHYICKRCKKRMQSIQPYLGSDSDGR